MRLLKRRTITTFAAMVTVIAMLALPASADPLPDNCKRVQGTVTCTTFEGPGNNQAGVGNETNTETKGNTKNTNPEPQDLQTECEQTPPKSQGGPIACP